MGDLKKWAENEINMAINQLDKSKENNFNDYLINCYSSAYKAFCSLLEDEHSNMSISVTFDILKKLIDNKPLSPIKENDEFILVYKNDEYEQYQCLRYSKLFKYVYKNGKTIYRDINKIICVDINSKNMYTFKLVEEELYKIFPIEFPYIPTEPIKVYCEDYLYDEKNGDFDTFFIGYYIDKDGTKIDINKYFKEVSDQGNIRFEEIDKEEYEYRKKNKKR